jgi:hypothetical protein
MIRLCAELCTEPDVPVTLIVWLPAGVPELPPRGSTGRILSPGNFGRVLSFDSSSRIIQLALKLSF